jgi:hypothetical protein
MRLLIFNLLVLFLIPLLCSAEDFNLSAENPSALQLMNNGQLLEAYSKLHASHEVDPESVENAFLLALVKWKMMLLSSYSASERDELLKLLQEIEEKTLPEIQENNYSLFLYASVIGVRAQVAATENRWWTTAQYGKRMKRYAERLIDQDPEYYEGYYLLGSFNYFADVLPSHIKFLRSLLFLPGGDRKEGLDQLITAYQKGNLVSGEAGKTLALIYTYYEKRHDYGSQMCENLLTRYPENFEIGLYSGINLYFESRFEKSAAWLEHVQNLLINYSKRNLTNSSGEEPGIVRIYEPLDREVRYWLARNYIQLRRYEESRAILMKLAEPEIHEPYWIMRGVLLSLAQLDYLEDNPKSAESRIDRVLRWQDVKDAHEKAKTLRKKKNKIQAFEIDFL